MVTIYFERDLVHNYQLQQNHGTFPKKGCAESYTLLVVLTWMLHAVSGFHQHDRREPIAVSRVSLNEHTSISKFSYASFLMLLGFALFERHEQEFAKSSMIYMAILRQ